ncbi:MAG: YciI family protein [Pseudomonadota bacterium]
MQAIIIAYESEADFAKRTAAPAAFEAYMDPWFTYTNKLTEAGVMAGGEALQGPETATCVSIKDGKRIIQDGPFLDAKEQIGGFFLINISTMDEATAHGKDCPAAKTGGVEIREVPDYSEDNAGEGVS